MAASLGVGPQLDPRPVQARDQYILVAASVEDVEVLSGDEASGGEHNVSYSTEEADVSQGSIPLLDISATDDDETRKRKVHVNSRAEVTQTTQHGKSRKLVKA